MSGPIVVGTDFEARADRAIDRAVALGKQLDREVILFHARELPPHSLKEDHGLDAKMEEVLPPGAQGVRFAYKLGRAPEGITELAEEQKADLLVLGVGRHNSLGDYFVGTSVDSTIRRTALPVLVVKKRAHRPYAKIAVATDFYSYSAKALEWAAEMFPEAEIHLLHAYHVPYAAWNNADYVDEELKGHAAEQMQSFVGDLPESIQSRVKTHIENATVNAAMNRLVAAEGIDLVVLGSHGETGFRHATIGSQASSLLSSTHADTIIVGPRVAG